jgi:hypothetical protein
MPTNQVKKQLIVVTQASMNPGQHYEEVALFNPDGTVLSVVQSPATQVITGYTIGTVAEEALAATDTINEALGKLEKRVADLEAV